MYNKCSVSDVLSVLYGGTWELKWEHGELLPFFCGKLLEETGKHWGTGVHYCDLAEFNRVSRSKTQQSWRCIGFRSRLITRIVRLDPRKRDGEAATWKEAEGEEINRGGVVGIQGLRSSTTWAVRGKTEGNEKQWSIMSTWVAEGRKVGLVQGSAQVFSRLFSRIFSLPSGLGEVG